MRGQRHGLMDLRGQVKTFGQVALLLQQGLCGDGIAGRGLRVDGIGAEQQAFGRANRTVGIGAQFKPQATEAPPVVAGLVNQVTRV